MTTFGEKLREFRRNASLSQEELAERSGLTAAAVGALERGERRHPYPHTVVALADALELSLEERQALVTLVPARPGSGASRDDEPHPVAAPPSPLAPIVGRRRELDTIRKLLHRPEARLVTLTGPGGVGKTRIAMEAVRDVAEAFADSVAWIELSSLTDASEVPSAIVRGLGLPEARSTPLATAVHAYLRRRRLLLVLDGFEHLLDASSGVVDLLRACPGVTVLVTSREALHVSGEYEVQVRPLSLPATHATGMHAVGSTDAVKLIIDRARAAAGDFRLTDVNAAAIAEICTRVDGLPLALELAAAHLKYFSPVDLARRLAAGAPLGVRTRALPARQRSLEATLDWSHDLLDARERVLFRRLAVFRGSFAVESVVAVCADDQLPASALPVAFSALLDKSLICPRGGAEGRFALLQTVHRYAAAKLTDSGDERASRDRHALHMAEVAESEEPALYGPARAEAMRRLGWDDDNFRCALEWSVTFASSHCPGVRLTGALGWYWVFRGALSELRHWTHVLLVDPPACHPGHVAAFLYTAAASRWKDGEIAAAGACADAAIEWSREAQDRRRLAFALSLRGLIAVSGGNSAEAAAFHRESVACFRSLGHSWGEAYARANLGDALFESGDSKAATDCYNQALAEFTVKGDSWGQAIVLHTLGNIALRDGDFQAAAEKYEASIALDRAADNRIELARSQVALAATLLHLGEADTAAATVEESLAIWEDYAYADGRALCLIGLAAVARMRGQREASTRLLMEARDTVSGRPAVYAVDPEVFEPFLPGRAANS